MWRLDIAVVFLKFFFFFNVYVDELYTQRALVPSARSPTWRCSHLGPVPASTRGTPFTACQQVWLDDGLIRGVTDGLSGVDRESRPSILCPHDIEYCLKQRYKAGHRGRQER